MTGQNTEKQILAMVILLVIAVASLGAYVWFDNGRRTEAASEVFERDAERGAHLFANNCRVCHGNDGRGQESDSSLVGPALNKPSNTYAWRTSNDGDLELIQGRYRGTITCGRNGTAMPPWAVAEGGSMNDFQIENLVTLVTTNAGDGWAIAQEVAHELDETTLGNLKTALRDAQAALDDAGWTRDTEAAQADVDAAEAASPELAQLRQAAQAAADALAEADDPEAAQTAADQAAEALAALEKTLTSLVLDAAAMRSLDDEIGDAAAARIAAAPADRAAIAHARAWLRASAGLDAAEFNLQDAEERVASNLPIERPAAQVTSQTCGQVHRWSDPGARAQLEAVGAWLSAARPGEG